MNSLPTLAPPLDISPGIISLLPLSLVTNKSNLLLGIWWLA
jgi:hypothetical protein